jgi:hypothetical protein
MANSITINCPEAGRVLPQTFHANGLYTHDPGIASITAQLIYSGGTVDGVVIPAKASWIAEFANAPTGTDVTLHVVLFLNGAQVAFADAPNLQIAETGGTDCP